jgi:hypothetical protein
MTVAALMARLPRKVRVGLLTYEIEVVDNLMDEGTKQNGLCIFTEQKIQLDSKPPSSQFAADTLLHEILHAIWGERVLNKNPSEEQIVTSLATGIAILLRDNPDLNAWITDALL